MTHDDYATIRDITPKHARKPRTLYRYNSVSAFGEALAAMPKLDYDAKKSSQEKNDLEWSGGIDYDQALKIATDGGAWREGAERLNDTSIAGDLGEKANVADLGIDHGVVGGCVDVGEYLSNSPECFTQVYEIEQAAPVVRVAVCAWVSCMYSADQLINRGRAVLGFINALEQRGYSVELCAVLPFIDKSADTQRVYEVAIKNAGEQWNPAAAAYALVHPAFMRRLGFRAVETHDQSISRHGYGCGRDASDYHHDADLYIADPLGAAHYDTADTALARVLEQVNAQAPHLDLKTVA